MTAECLRDLRTADPVAALVFCAVTVLCPFQASAESCTLPSQHAGVTFPVETVDAPWTCRLEPIITHYTTANKVGPLRISMDETVYRYLLDRPPTAAALLNRLELGLYKAEARGPGRYWGSDGEGTEGLIELVHKENASRIYYLEGSHHSRLLRNLTGRAVVFLRMVPVKDAKGLESVETTLVSYARIDNRILSGLLSLLRPLIGDTVTRKLAKGVESVNRLGLEMRQHPHRVLFEAMDPPALPADDVAFLRRMLNLSDWAKETPSGNGSIK